MDQVNWCMRSYISHIEEFEFDQFVDVWIVCPIGSMVTLDYYWLAKSEGKFSNFEQTLVSKQTAPRS